MLTDEEISELDTKCKKFGADFRVAFPGKAQTPKGHWLERHVGASQSGLGLSESSDVMAGKRRTHSGKKLPPCAAASPIPAHG